MTSHWIDNSEALDALLVRYRGAPAVAIDTEFRRRDTFYPQVALVQLCWGDEAYLLDPLSLDNTASLEGLLSDPTVIKLIHSASEDLEVFSRWLGRLPSPLFDTQRAAALLGMGAGLSYRALVAAFFDIELPKDETQSDWLQRPLSSKQMTYAAQDVTYLFPAGVKLLDRSRKLGRLDWVLEDGARMLPGGKPPIGKFKSAHKLPVAQQRALIAVVEWREHEARKLDRPRSWILQDKLVSAVARALPETVQQLASVADVPNGLVRRAGETLVAKVQRAVADFGLDLSQISPPPLPASARSLSAALADRTNRIAQEQGIAQEVLMAKADLEHLIRQLSDPLLPDLPAWSGWRQAVVVQPLKTWLLEARPQ